MRASHVSKYVIRLGSEHGPFLRKLLNTGRPAAKRDQHQDKETSVSWGTGNVEGKHLLQRCCPDQWVHLPRDGPGDASEDPYVEA